MLQISENNRYIVKDDGSPFFYLGDTAWCLFHRLNREEAGIYLENRAAKGFTVVQAVVLSEHGGLRVPNALGEREFIDGDMRRPNERYFEHVDYIVDLAASLGLHVGMLPSWGDKVGVNYWGEGPAHFVNEENSEYWGGYLGERYGSKPVIWILGGDRPFDCNEEIWRKMAKGIKSSETEPHLMTYHPMGGYSSSHWLQPEEWLDFNMMQTGHGAFVDTWRKVGSDYSRLPTKPVMDGEPCYEDHPDGFNQNSVYLNDYHVRVAAYWAMLAGAHGHTYGCHAMWQFWDPAKTLPINWPKLPWTESLHLPGASQMSHMRRFFESRPFLSRIPDQSLITDGQRFGLGHVQAGRDGTKGKSDASYIMVYFSKAHEVEIRTGCIAGDGIRGWWFNPRTGEAEETRVLEKRETQAFSTPDDNMGRDWVLVLDDSSMGYGPPGVATP